MPYLHLRLVLSFGGWQVYRDPDTGAWFFRFRGGPLRRLWGRREA